MDQKIEEKISEKILTFVLYNDSRVDRYKTYSILRLAVFRRKERKKGAVKRNCLWKRLWKEVYMKFIKIMVKMISWTKKICIMETRTDDWVVKIWSQIVHPMTKVFNFSSSWYFTLWHLIYYNYGMVTPLLSQFYWFFF